jgi:hypothetical protein
MFFALVFLTELYILFLLSKSLTTLLFMFFHKLTRNKKLSTYLMGILFLPGTIIHELSHAIMARVLFVPVGRMEFLPNLTGNNLKLGSVEVGKSDPLRKFLIGAAPFLFGVALIIGAFYFAVVNNLLIHRTFAIITGYFVFEIGNTMFSSKKDMEGALKIFLAIFVLIIIYHLTGLRFQEFNPQILFDNPSVYEVFQKSSFYLAVPIGIDIILIVLLKLLKTNYS